VTVLNRNLPVLVPLNTTAWRSPPLKKLLVMRYVPVPAIVRPDRIAPPARTRSMMSSQLVARMPW
jgi:hypothetical protein